MRLEVCLVVPLAATHLVWILGHCKADQTGSLEEEKKQS